MSAIIVPDSDGRSSQPKPERARFGLTSTQVLLLPLILGAGLVLLLATVQVALVNTLGIFLFVTLVGLWRCRATALRLADSKLRVLGTLWLLKIGATIFLQYYGGWVGLFSVNDYLPGEGYDAYRFYYDAYALIENDWIPPVASNYQGIIYYYGSIFSLFGWNPVIPGLINIFVTLLGFLYLIRVIYEVKPLRGPSDWKIAFLVLIPEFISWDVQTSRETLMAVLLTVSILASGRLIFRTGNTAFAPTFLMLVVAFLVIASVRTSMLIPLVAVIGIMVLWSRGKNLATKVALLSLLILIFVGGPLLQSMTGGVSLSMIDLLQGGGVKTAEDGAWTANSIGQLLSPSNTWEEILFTFPRAVVYLVAPLPTIYFSLAGLINQERASWHELMTVASSVLNILVFPYVLAGFRHFWKMRRTNQTPLVMFFISFAVLYLAITAGNVIIHERYRIMAMPLYFACAWLGYTSVRASVVRQFALAWFGALALGVVFFAAYKI